MSETHIISTSTDSSRGRKVTICIAQSSVQHIYLVRPVTEQHSHIYAPLSTRGHCGYTNRPINTGSMKNLQGNQDSFILLAIGSSL